LPLRFNTFFFFSFDDIFWGVSSGMGLLAKCRAGSLQKQTCFSSLSLFGSQPVAWRLIVLVFPAAFWNSAAPSPPISRVLVVRILNIHCFLCTQNTHLQVCSGYISWFGWFAGFTKV
jgi:hypothetical protein